MTAISVEAVRPGLDLAQMDVRGALVAVGVFERVVVLITASEPGGAILAVVSGFCVERRMMVMSEREMRELAAELERHLDGLPVDQLLATAIEPNPVVPGPGDVRLVGFGVPIWALVGHWSRAQVPIEQVAADYELPLEAALAAFGYYLRHRAAIDERLAANAA